MDGQSVLGYFDGQIAAEIRLPEAIDRKLLCPFEYFGVSDSVDLDGLRWTNGGYAHSDLDNLYVFSHETAIRRADLIIRKVLDYTTDINAVKGLGFCVSVKHADFMAEQFMKAGIPSISLSAESSDAERDSAKTRLQRGEIKFIFVVDLYNEGDSIQGVRRRRRVMAKKVTVIPAKVTGLLPSLSAENQSGRYAGMRGFPLTMMSSSLPMKRNWVTTRITSKPMTTGSSSGCIRMKESAARTPSIVMASSPWSGMRRPGRLT